MSLYQIERNIPLPPRPAPSGRAAKYPFQHMKKGETFFVPKMTSAGLGARADYWARKLGMKFSVRAEGKGARVWRVK